MQIVLCPQQKRTEEIYHVIRPKEKLASDGYPAPEATLHDWLDCPMETGWWKARARVRCCYNSIGGGLCWGGHNGWETDTFLSQ